MQELPAENSPRDPKPPGEVRDETTRSDKPDAFDGSDARTRLMMMEIMESHSGPLPSPQTLEGYDRVCPGAADRIIRMAEVQAKHRQELEQIAVRGNVANERQAQWFAFTIAMTFGLGSVVLIAMGKGVSGVVTLVGTLASLIAVFFRGVRVRDRELNKKTQIQVPEGVDSDSS